MPVENGDLLFRYLIPSQFESRGGLLSKERYTRKLLRKIIELQKTDIGNRNLWTANKYISDYLGNVDLKTLRPVLYEKMETEAKTVRENMQLVGHVGIADVENGEVLEIGNGGFNAVDIEERAHYDIVVRFADKGRDIAKKARAVYEKNKAFRYSGTFVHYPASQLPKILESPADPSLFSDPEWKGRREWSDYSERLTGTADVMRSEVVCSHLVHAILYAVFEPAGTVATATKEEFTKIFRISPANLLRFIRYGLGLFQNAPKADVVGVQHEGGFSEDAVRLVDVLGMKGKITGLDYLH